MAVLEEGAYTRELLSLGRRNVGVGWRNTVFDVGVRSPGESVQGAIINDVSDHHAHGGDASRAPVLAPISIATWIGLDVASRLAIS